MGVLVLFETPAGYALFKVLDKGKLKEVDEIHREFESPEKAQQVVQLNAFKKFDDTTQALAAATSIADGTLDKGLKKFLKTCVVDQGAKVKLAVEDKKLATLIKEKLGISCQSDDAISELFRGIRLQLDSLLSGLSDKDLKAMKLGLSHSLCRYKLKFSPDKVDTMIVQAISLLDELDKELNTYAMRVREWYGWHFPEMGKLIADNIVFARIVKKMGIRKNASKTDFSDILPEEQEQEVKEQAEISMGTEILPEDIDNIQQLCDQVINISQYRTELYNYLKNRMQAIAPNLTVMVGELVGARLIAHAGSLLNLAKSPASTVQILGAEKALFRALKTKHDTPKYGLIYHASLVGQATPKNKGKISRVLAAKTALCIRMDALGETEGLSIGLGHRAKVEQRMAQIEGGNVKRLSGTGKTKAREEKYAKPSKVPVYNESADIVVKSEPGVAVEEEKEKKKKKKEKKEPVAEEPAVKVEAGEEEKVKKKKKRQLEEAPAAPIVAPVPTQEEPKKKKKKKVPDAEPVAEEP